MIIIRYILNGIELHMGDGKTFRFLQMDRSSDSTISKKIYDLSDMRYLICQCCML